MEHNKQKRSSLKKMGMGFAALLGVGTLKAAAPLAKKKIVSEIVNDQDIPLFSGAVRHGNTLYIAGKGAHFDGDIKSHTDHVLKELLDICKGIDDSFTHDIVSTVIMLHQSFCNSQQPIFMTRQSVYKQFWRDNSLLGLAIVLLRPRSRLQ